MLLGSAAGELEIINFLHPAEIGTKQKCMLLDCGGANKKKIKFLHSAERRATWKGS
jgi:hypothetical protein